MCETPTSCNTPSTTARPSPIPGWCGESIRMDEVCCRAFRSRGRLELAFRQTHWIDTRPRLPIAEKFKVSASSMEAHRVSIARLGGRPPLVGKRTGIGNVRWRALQRPTNVIHTTLITSADFLNMSCSIATPDWLEIQQYGLRSTRSTSHQVDQPSDRGDLPSSRASALGVRRCLAWRWAGVGHHQNNRSTPTHRPSLRPRPWCSLEITSTIIAEPAALTGWL